MDKDLFQSRIRLRHLHCFLAVAQERNLRKAAERLRLSQPAVSKTLVELEQIVGVRLFERSRLGAQLTREGEIFLARTVPALEALDAVGNALETPGAPAAESIVIGVLPSVAPDLLPAVLVEYQRNHPDVRITVQTGTNAILLQMLKAGEMDCVLGRMADPQMMVGLVFELLYVEPLRLFVRAGHPLAGRSALSLSEVMAFPFIVPLKGTIPRHNTESFLQSHGMALPRNCIETVSVSLARAICLQSDAVWFISAGAIHDELEARRFAPLTVGTEGAEEPVGLLHRSEGALRPAVRDFMVLLRAAGRRRSAAIAR
ncbi:MAG TPA: pca operon transcription factor PcaQ [Noviherbaspirillum sp.]|uniref:pca operon transcription factor PcaQ n=1 Tax=Noviherbaspirillum sp. TaxID=1926288 RepID=UPI002B47BB14|nr:pca operon transcription factor PcaQ [Noviherbaspirillum sp.]HJV88275.1 pca operon transcription factor PcaQ [Noviherbaspirillum sp.]